MIYNISKKLNLIERKNLKKKDCYSCIEFVDDKRFKGLLTISFNNNVEVAVMNLVTNEIYNRALSHFQTEFSVECGDDILNVSLF